MALGICAICGERKAAPKHKYCDNCKNICIVCKKAPRIKSMHFCTVCNKEYRTKMRALGDAKPCKRCGESLPRKHGTSPYCATCQTMCSKCGVRPKHRPNFAGYCKECQHLYRMDYIQRQIDYGDVVKHQKLKTHAAIRSRVARQVKKGIRERMPCAICEDPQTLAFVREAEREFIVWLCRKHHDQATGRVGKATLFVSQRGRPRKVQ